MRFDPRHWNVLAGAAIAAVAGAGCGIPSSVPLALTIGGEESEGDSGNEVGEDGAPECESHADCDPWERCSPGGYCYYYDYCGGPDDKPERCQPYDDDWGDGDGDGDGDCLPQYCGFGSDCDDGQPYCGPVPPVPGCAPALAPTEIPVDVLPPGVLHFAQADEDPELEPILVSQESVWLLAPDDGTVKLPRANPAGAPEWVEHMDLDKDGVDELLITDGFGTTIVFPLNGEPERSEALPGPLAIVDLHGDGGTFVASLQNNGVSISEWIDGVLSLRWELAALNLLGPYSPDATPQQRLGWGTWAPNDVYTVNSSGLMGDVFESGELVLEPYSTTTGAGLELTRQGAHDLVVQATNGASTKFRIYGEEFASIRGMVPGYYSRPPTSTVVDGYPAIVGLGELDTVVVLVEAGTGLLCYQPLPYFHSAAGGDFDQDGTPELLVQYPNGVLAAIALE